MLPFIILVVFLSIVAGVGVLTYKQIQKTSASFEDTSTKPNIETAQEFLPFKDIKNGMIDLGGDSYRAIIEVGSINYDLRTEGERNMVNASYQRFLNSLTTDISIYIQTRQIDLTEVLEGLEKDIAQTSKDFPQLENYGQIFYEEMLNLTKRIGNNTQKKKYIIVHYDEAKLLDDLTAQERYEYAAKEIYVQANIIVDGLQGIGLRADILGTKELVEVVYAAYNRRDYMQVKNIVNGEYLRNIVSSDVDYIQSLSHEDHLDNTLYQAMHSIQQKLLHEKMNQETTEKYEEYFRKLEGMRRSNSNF